ncbi:MFS transporter [Ornithinimicrobium pekingense]|uniref:MFS transporter n=1 Tax=Ornithinimicrobium pekingense TaxID=384677 RepID=A0ABQ2F6R9_9MICO|nr:MFS transporter [Ornithinimicrobium pekingense]GGK66270.1 MFS transporter [Ornithinimicrobium pekingense]
MTTEAAAAAPRQSLFRHHDFRQLWMGDTVSVFGMQFVGLAMPLLAVQVLGASAFEMGLLATLESLAFLLISLPAGAWVDRWRKKRVLVAGDLLRAALLLTVPLAWLLDVLTMGQLLVVAFAVGCITVFFDVANQSYLPEIVDGAAIGEGNAKLQASQQTAIVVGPAAAGALVRVVGSPLTIAVTSVCMALSSLFVSRIRHREQTPDPAARRPLATEVKEGMAFVLGHPLLRRIVACTGLSNLASSAVFALFVLYAVRTLGLSETTLGLVMSAGAVGGLLGAVTADRTARLVGEGRVIPLAAVVGGAAMVAVPLASVLPPLPTLLVGQVVAWWGVVTYNIAQVSFRQRLCPRPLLGRMNASIRFLVWGPMPVGAFLGGLLGRDPATAGSLEVLALGLVPTMWVFSVLGLAAALPVLLSPLVGMRQLPRSLDALAEEGRR